MTTAFNAALDAQDWAGLNAALTEQERGGGVPRGDVLDGWHVVEWRVYSTPVLSGFGPDVRTTGELATTHLVTVTTASESINGEAGRVLDSRIRAIKFSGAGRIQTPASVIDLPTGDDGGACVLSLSRLRR